MERQQKQIVICDSEQYEHGFPSSNAVECVAWFAEQLAKIPEEYRDKAVINIDTKNAYDSSYANIEIYYMRPETDEEMLDRFTYEQRQREEKASRDLKLLAELKAKYES